MSTFHDLGLKQEILDAIADLGFQTPTAVQAEVIPFMLYQQDDLVALAQTGTGKTAAFGLPLLTTLDNTVHQTQVLVLAPTRELCMQIANDLKKYAAYQKKTKIVAVYGGENIVNQFKQLDVRPHVLVATPGRLIDLINREKVFLHSIQNVVLDEADEMLNMGFQEDIETILKSIQKNHRTLLFSATMPKEIALIAKKYMNNSREIAIGERNAGAKNVNHIYYMVQASNRYLALKRIMDINPDIYGIVFCRTRQETKDVAEKLMHDGYNADALHGDLSQAQRDTVMNKFRQKTIQVLVATDVAARGLDVNNLSHVINYNLPDDVEVYTHRSGRTGRADKKGTSVSIIHSREKSKIKRIENMIGKEFSQQEVPSGMDICKKQLFHFIDKMENVQINDHEIDPFVPEVLGKLSYLSREDIIKKFISLEFNRFALYYQNAPDLNIKEKNSRGEEQIKKMGKGKQGQKITLKINYGNNAGAAPRKILAIINKATGDRSIHIDNIDITAKFTFFDVYVDQAELILYSFLDQDKYIVDIAKGGKNESGSFFQKDKKHSKRKGFSRTEESNKPKRKKRR